jgi:hypothetical protein
MGVSAVLCVFASIGNCGSTGRGHSTRREGSVALQLKSMALRTAAGAALLGCCGCSQQHADPSPIASPQPPVAEGRLVQVLGAGSDTDMTTARFGVPVVVHGHTLLLMADLGADATALTAPAFDSIRVPRMFANARRVAVLTRAGGIEPARDSTADVTVTLGDSIWQYWGDFPPPVIDTLRVGGVMHTDVAIPLEIASGALRPFDGILGRELLSQYDLEFNFPERMLRLYARYAPVRPGEVPRWLPPQTRSTDCMAAPIVAGTMPDTVGMDGADKRLLRSLSMRRIWETPWLRLPLVINGHSVTGLFDSGADETTINSAAARALGLRLDDSATRATIVYGETRHEVSSTSVRLGDHPLLAGKLVVSDSSLAKFPDSENTPWVLLGFQHLLDRTLFLSYSTGMVCVGAAPDVHPSKKSSRTDSR